MYVYGYIDSTRICVCVCVPPPGPDIGSTMAARMMHQALFGDGNSGTPPPPTAEAAGGGAPRHGHPTPRPSEGERGSGPAVYAGAAARDPYMTSPGHAGGRLSGPAVSPSARGSPYPETAAPPVMPADSIAARLAANRAANPFVDSAGELSSGSLRGIDPTRRPVPTLIEDDEELEAPPDPGGTPMGI